MNEEMPVRMALLENLKQLHLPTMRACFEEAAQRAEKETLSYEQYLLELAERECESRQRNRIAKILKESGLPQEKTLANFDLKRLPLKVARQLKVLLDGRGQQKEVVRFVKCATTPTASELGQSTKL